MPRGGGVIEPRVLFGKYRLCRKLGSGRSGTVYLAFHLELQEYRAIKAVPKTSVGYETFLREALILKTLRHPGIPIVYDVEEDLYYSYLVEEYLEGESLYALVKRLGGLSMELASNLGIQICQLVKFMYSAENPILYLDLQPKNLLVNDGKIKLIDFNHAQFAVDMQREGERYGTVGFAAPEQYSGEPLDCRADIYAIGMLLIFMCLGRLPAQGEEARRAGYEPLLRIAGICTEPKRENRYQTAEGLLGSLEELLAGITKEHAIKSRIIIFVGAQQGIGTTHAALGISSFLARRGEAVLYQEDHDTGAARRLAKNYGAKAGRSGIYHIEGIQIRPFYRGSVRLPNPYFPIMIKDLGVAQKSAETFAKADLIVLICGGKWWEIDASVRAARELKNCGTLILLWNHMSGEFRVSLPEDLRGIPSMNLPFFANPFRPDGTADACFAQILERGEGENTRWGKKKSGFRPLQKWLRRTRPES